jgi:biopolymer transport protein ExbD
VNQPTQGDRKRIGRPAYTKPRVKTFMVKPAGNTNTEINVTPLIDVVLVLLIIFMVLTPLKESELPVAVPASEQADDPSEMPPDQLIVYLAKNGTTKLNATALSGDALAKALKERLAARKEADRTVFVVAEDEANYGKLVAVIDTAKLAGAQTIGYATEAPDPQLFQ